MKKNGPMVPASAQIQRKPAKNNFPAPASAQPRATTTVFPNSPLGRRQIGVKPPVAAITQQKPVQVSKPFIIQRSAASSTGTTGSASGGARSGVRGEAHKGWPGQLTLSNGMVVDLLALDDVLYENNVTTKAGNFHVSIHIRRCLGIQNWKPESDVLTGKYFVTGKKYSCAKVVGGVGTINTPPIWDHAQYDEATKNLTLEVYSMLLKYKKMLVTASSSANQPAPVAVADVAPQRLTAAAVQSLPPVPAQAPVQQMPPPQSGINNPQNHLYRTTMNPHSINFN